MIELSADIIDAVGGDTTARRRVETLDTFARGVPTIAGLGDSITNQNTMRQDNVLAYNAKGDIAWACAFLRGRIRFPVSYNFGVSGQTSAQILARVGDVIAARPGFCRVLAGTNDANAGDFSPDTTWENLRTIYDALIAAGIVVIACPILPRSYAGNMTPDQLRQAQMGFQCVNRRMRSHAAMVGANRMVVPAYELAVANQANSSYVPINFYMGDGLHPIAAAASQMGLELAKALDRFLPPAPYSGGIQNTYDERWNPLGNRHPNGEMTGTGGQSSGEGVSGTVASGWLLRRIAGANSTVVASKETIDARTGAVRQVLTIGGAAPTTSEQVEFSRQVTGVTGGEFLRGFVEVEARNLFNVRNIALRVQDNSSTPQKNYGLNSSGAVGDRLPSDIPLCRIETPPFVVPSGATALTFALEVQLQGSEAATGTIGIHRAELSAYNGGIA